MTETLWYVGGVLAFVVGLAASIALHEIGHLVPAKRFGVRVTQYMIGFGPTIWSRVRGETEYGVKGIPLGGYIRMIGMFPPARGTTPGVTPVVAQADAAAAGRGRSGTSGMFTGLIEGARAQAYEEFRPGDEQRSFYALRVWQKLVIMCGGPVMNLLIGTVLLGSVWTLYGTGQATTTIGTVSQCVLPADAPADATCSATDTPAPAAAAGLRPGDTILSIDGRATPTWDDTSEAIRSAGDRQVDVVVRRGGTELTLPVSPIVAQRPVFDDRGEPLVRDGVPVTMPVGFFGVTPTSELQRVPVWEVPRQTADTVVGVVGVIARLPQHLVGVADAAFGSGERDPNGPISIVGVGRLSGEAAAYDPPGVRLAFADRLAQFAGLLGGLNIGLFVFNLVPLLPLDGGHAAGALWEGAKKLWARLRSRPDPGPVDVAKALPLAYGVAVVLLGVSALLIYADIVRPISLTG